MYSLAMREWASSLCTLDSESCLVTWLLPCHVYAKLNLSSYGMHFLSYTFIVLGIRNIYSVVAYYHTYECPATKTDQCILIEKDQCNHHFMSINGVDTPCVYYGDVDACIFGQVSCIQVHHSTYTWFYSLLSMLYLCIFYMNYKARQVIRNTYSIEPRHECIAATGCSQCGLAQAYREIV